MRILYHHRTLADGAEGIHIDEMIQAFRTLGHEVRVIGVAHSDSPSQLQTVSRIKATLPAAMFEVAAMCLNVPEYIRIRRQIHSFRPDLLYKRHAKYDVAALLAARATGVQSVLEVNCVFSHPHYLRFEPQAFRGITRWFERKALDYASVVVTVSSALARQVEEIATTRPLVLPNGADSDRFDPQVARPDAVRARYQLTGMFTVGWSGILREWHGMVLLLEAIALLDDVHLLIIGDGPARSALETHAAALGIQHRVRVTGRIPNSEMPSHLAAVDVCVVADELTGVASPMKLFEYMAMERAVVAPGLANIREVIADGVDGLLFTPRDATALANAIRRLAADRALRHRLGQQARVKIVTRYNWKRNAELVIEASCGDPGIVTDRQ